MQTARAADVTLSCGGGQKRRQVRHGGGQGEVGAKHRQHGASGSCRPPPLVMRWSPLQIKGRRYQTARGRVDGAWLAGGVDGGAAGLGGGKGAAALHDAIARETVNKDT